jgi:hypothetical protein
LNTQTFKLKLNLFSSPFNSVLTGKAGFSSILMRESTVKSSVFSPGKPWCFAGSWESESTLSLVSAFQKSELEPVKSLPHHVAPITGSLFHGNLLLLINTARTEKAAWKRRK